MVDKDPQTNVFPSMRYCVDHNCKNYPDGLFINLGSDKSLKCHFCGEVFDPMRCRAYHDDHIKLFGQQFSIEVNQN